MDQRNFLRTNLKGIVPVDALDAIVEYLLTFDVNNDLHEMKSYLIEFCGQEAASSIIRLVEVYQDRFGNKKEPEKTVNKEKLTSKSATATPTTGTTLSTVTTSVKKPQTFNNPVFLPSATGSRYREMNLSQIGIKKTKKQLKKAQDGDASEETSNRRQCNCFGTKHPYIGSCTTCGRLYCEVEGPIPKSGLECYFCQGLVLYPISAEEVVNCKYINADEATIKAYQHKDKLLIFDKENAKRTHVYDAQADYYDSSAWLTEQEKKALVERDNKRREKYKPKNRKTFISVNLSSGGVRHHNKHEQDSDEDNQPESHPNMVKCSPYDHQLDMPSVHDSNSVDALYLPQTAPQYDRFITEKDENSIHYDSNKSVNSLASATSRAGLVYRNLLSRYSSE